MPLIEQVGVQAYGQIFWKTRQSTVRNLRDSLPPPQILSGSMIRGPKEVNAA